MKKVVNKFAVILLVVAVVLSIATSFADASGVQCVEIAGGFCGKNGADVEWSYFDNGELVISGNGEMRDYTWELPAPWNVYADEIKSARVENGITKIGNCAFAWTWLMRDVSIPGSVVVIGDNAFYNSGLTSVSLPYGLESIGAGAFNSCNFKSIEISETVKVIGEGAFYYCDLTSVVIPDSVTTIGKEAFAGCFDLAEVVISKNVTKLGQSAFASCYALRSVTIPDSVKEIGNWCFFNCKALEEADIPATVQVIGEGAFKGCTSFSEVNYRGTFAQWKKISIGTDNAKLASAQVTTELQASSIESSAEVAKIKNVFVNSVFLLTNLAFGIEM